MFALHRRKAWQGAQIEASAWNFDIAGITYVGQTSLTLASSGTQQHLVFHQFVDDGTSFIYSSQYASYKLSLPVPYSIISSNLIPVATVGNLVGSSTYRGQFSGDGRNLYLYTATSGVNNFKRLQLDVPYDIFSKSNSDVISITPSRPVTDGQDGYFSADGLKFYTFPCNGTQAELHQYGLSEPFDASTLSLAMTSVSLWALAGGVSNSTGFSHFAISPDGFRIISAGGTYASSSGLRLRMWYLQVPWDISRISHLGTINLDSHQAESIDYVFVDPTATYLYVASGRNIFQYAIPQS